MSHFVVLVATRSPSDVARVLQPFHQFECTGTVDQFVVDVDDTDEVRQAYAKQTEDRVRMPDGSLLSPYDGRFWIPLTAEESAYAFGGSFFDRKDTLKDGTKVCRGDFEDGKGYREAKQDLGLGVLVPDVAAAHFQSLTDFACGWTGRKTILEGTPPDIEGAHKYGFVVVDKDGAFVRCVDRTNPNARWDWYEIGGRWDGYLLTRFGGLNQVRKSEVDVVGMRAAAAKTAADTFDAFADLFADGQRIPSWNEVREANKDDIDKARALYAADPRVEQFQQRARARGDWFSGDIRETFHEGDRASYVAAAEANALRTFAFVDLDGSWHQKGDTVDHAYAAEFRAWFDALADDVLLTVVDCHI